MEEHIEKVDNEVFQDQILTFIADLRIQMRDLQAAFEKLEQRQREKEQNEKS